MKERLVHDKIRMDKRTEELKVRKGCNMSKDAINMCTTRKIGKIENNECCKKLEAGVQTSTEFVVRQTPQATISKQRTPINNPIKLLMKVRLQNRKRLKKQARKTKMARCLRARH